MGINPLVQSVCKGKSASITTSGTVTKYFWSNGGGNASSAIYTPVATSTYTVTGTDGNNCSISSASVITVLPLPTITYTPLNPTICSGDFISFTASGASSYVWSTGATGPALNNVHPTITTSYTLTANDANGCVNNTLAVKYVLLFSFHIFCTFRIHFCNI